MQLFLNTQLHLVGGGMLGGQVQALRLDYVGSNSSSATC